MSNNIFGENVILEEACFEGIRAKQVNIPEKGRSSHLIQVNLYL